MDNIAMALPGLWLTRDLASAHLLGLSSDQVQVLSCPDRRPKKDASFGSMI